MMSNIGIRKRKILNRSCTAVVIGESILLDGILKKRPHSALDGATPAEAYSASRPVDMMDKARALPTSPQALQQQKAFNTNVSLAA